MQRIRLPRRSSPIRFLLGQLFGERLLHQLFRVAAEKQDLIATYDFFDVSQQVELPQYNPKEVIGVVIQGPISKEITFEFCNYLNATYPEVKVVLSTWEGEDVSEFSSLLGNNFELCLSRKPTNPGPSNINLQVASTVAGLDILNKQGCTHILKTRTDIFFGNPQFLNYLSSIRRKGNPGAIVFSSFNSFLFRIFSPTDQVMFGAAEDISSYWSIGIVPQDTEIRIPEQYLFKMYLKSKGFETFESLNSYLNALREFTVIADHEQLGQVWNKGTYTSLSFRWRGESFPNTMSPLSYWLWDLIKNDDSYIEKLSRKIT
ncbi:WavE lipopolysaccharide synthesis [Candidatus Nanopelagicaceae bacterium]